MSLMNLGFWLLTALSLVCGWTAWDWWLVRRPLHAPTERGRQLRYARIEAGRPLSSRCTECGRRLRKSVWHPSWKNPLSPDVGVCGTCIKGMDGHNDLHMWMGFDLVRW